MVIGSLCSFVGTGEHASQQGMSMGSIRHAPTSDDMAPQSHGMLHVQTGMLFSRYFHQLHVYVCVRIICVGGEKYSTP